MKTTMTNKLFMKIRRRIYRIACLLFAAGLLVLGSCNGNQTTVPPDSEPLTIAPSTPDPPTTDPSTPDPPTLDPSTTDPSNPDPSNPDPSTSDPPTTDPSTTDPVVSVSTLLIGTKWKLAGIVDMETGELKELEPKDCKECYTIEFVSDSLVRLSSSANEGSAHLDGNPHLNITFFDLAIWTERAERGDGRLFTGVVNYITSYIQEDNELKFFYQIDKKKSYLLYKLIQP
jgi:hypothetical protein